LAEQSEECDTSPLKADEEIAPEASRKGVGAAKTIKFPLLKWAIGVAAAAAVIFLLTTWPFRQAPQNEINIVSNQVPTSEENLTDSAAPQLKFKLVGQSHDNYIALPQETSSPRVHIVWLYKTIKPLKSSSDAAPTFNRAPTVRS